MQRALTPEQIEMLGDKYLISLYQRMEDEVIADIARRVRKMDRYTETAELMAKHMREQGFSPAKIQAEVLKRLQADKDYKMFVAENTKAHKDEIREIIKKTVEEAKKRGDQLIAEAGEMAWNSDLSMWAEHGVDLKKPNTMSQLVAAFKKQTIGTLRNLTLTTGFKNVNTGTVGIMNVFQNELDFALLNVVSGTFSYDQAVTDCIKRLAQSGLRHIDYASGKSYQLDTAVRMCVRTGCSQLAGKIMEENLKSTGQDLVITSQHMGSRPEHAPWQNKVFSYSGKSKKYPDFFKKTGYGTVDGLKGANCAHDFYPFWEGASVIPDDIVEPEPKTINGKKYTYYQCTQKQRAMERDIRALKREINATETLGMDATELKSKLRWKKQEYVNFSAEARIRPKENRLRIVEGSSDITKTKAYGKAKKIRNAGALSNANDPYGRKREKHANGYYDEIRNRKSSYVIKRIEKNAGITNEEAKNVYEHIFINEHKFADGRVERFAPDYDMSESFRRILEGKNIKPHDITMINHEKLEFELMEKYNMVYEEAHAIAESKHNYKKELDEFLERLGG